MRPGRIMSSICFSMALLVWMNIPAQSNFHGRETFMGVFGKSGGEMFIFQYGFLKVGLSKSWFMRNDLCLDP